MPTATRPNSGAPPLPSARGPLSDTVLAALRRPAPAHLSPPPLDDLADPWGEDLQLALYVCYELHYRGFAAVDDAWEWSPPLLALRGWMERSFLAALRREVGEPPPLATVLADLLAEPPDGDGPSYHLLTTGTRLQAREYLVHRSTYHLKEADPQMWAVPRLPNPAKAALVAVQYDEYGAGRPERAHAELFAAMMADFGLDPAYGAHLDAVPAPALAVVNTMSLFGLHRSLRAALVGQFAAVEITSPPGAARLATAFERLGASPRGTLFYREHVLADAVHEQLVRHTVIEPLLARPPECSERDIAFGALAYARAEDRLADHLMAAWRSGTCSLRTPLPEEPLPEERPTGERPAEEPFRRPSQGAPR
ncbi:iron-containing redox enzyme family protein [Kitasatospora sp. NA04385]|uniref:iron-containing redox enzyme family protein n=1 Tax=Kitasatospora sp. NA04385 TaxID=2742135 RepID=UPI0015924CC9|nr:iron-containing redox enzyme family protein [Kitasatospora sp. NA04385]QKW24048.1 iron-containing redox enzyme family protein [Kitasatospora sp. NA04385]